MKIKLLLFAVAALLMSACSSNDITEPNKPADKGFTPIIHATQGNDDKASTRAGVIEENDYTRGENFYWNIDDKATVDFSGTRLEYKVTAVGEPRNQATFATNNTLPTEGTYDITGYFPASAWTLGATTHEAIIPAVQTQTDRTSAHLGAHMLMIAKSDGVTVNGITPINLQYKHMASVLRFAVWNTSGNDKLKLTNIKVSLKSLKPVFHSRAKLLNIKDESLTVVESSSSSNISLKLTNTAQNFEEKDTKQQCEGYMTVFPTAADAFAPTDDLLIELSLTDGVNDYTVIKTYNVGTDLSFLTGGIEQGKSYYFRLKVEPGDVGIQTYSLGDYYPDPNVDLSKPTEKAKIQGIVYWLDPAHEGRKGLVVSLDEGTKHWDDAQIWCANKGVDWYLPTLAELQYLSCAYNGKVAETWDIYPSFSRDTNAHAAFNKKLNDAGGTVLAYNWHWSSSERNLDFARNMYLGQGEAREANKGYSGRVRAVSAF